MSGAIHVPAGLALRRRPDFIVLGAMKAGTTSLFAWLADHPEVGRPKKKEPGFFLEAPTAARCEAYARNLEVAGAKKVGDASVAYADPAVCREVAARVAALAPDAPLLLLTRDRAKRLRSHYRHEVQRGRERRPLAAALAEDGEASAYVRRSLYAPAVEAFEGAAFRREAVESLVGDDGAAWDRVLSHLGLAPHPRPGTWHNRGAGKRQFSPVLLWAFDRGLTRFTPRVPKPLRRALGRVLLRDTPAYRRLLSSADARLPAWVEARFREDEARVPMGGS